MDSVSKVMVVARKLTRLHFGNEVVAREVAVAFLRVRWRHVGSLIVRKAVRGTFAFQGRYRFQRILFFRTVAFWTLSY